MLEDALNANTAALIALTAALNARTSGAKASAPTTPAAPSVTVEQVRDKMKALMDSKGKDAVVKVLASVGAKKLGDVTSDKLALCMENADKEMAAAGAELF